jgi:hypothetical protein
MFVSLIILFVLTALFADEKSLVHHPPDGVVKELNLAPFYEKYVSAGGIPIIGSRRTDDAALCEAAFLIDHMLQGRDDVRKALIENHVRVTVMAYDEFTTMVPEHSDLRPAKYWDKRARGLGATPERPATSCGEENLLEFPGDPYYSENILIHEFSHTIHQMGLSSVDPSFDKRLQQTYEAALADGLWKDTYAATNSAEYWAEGVQSWFNCNRQDDSQHNHVNTREELQQYDPRLAKLMEEVFKSDPKWRYQRPSEREQQDRLHLGDFNLQDAPRFSWPKQLLSENLSSKELQQQLPELKFVKNVEQIPNSKNSDRETSLLIINQREQRVVLIWIDEQGERREYARIASGQSHLQQTYAGHCWLISDDDNKALGYVVADQESSRVIVD